MRVSTDNFEEYFNLECTTYSKEIWNGEQWFVKISISPKSTKYKFSTLNYDESAMLTIWKVTIIYDIYNYSQEKYEYKNKLKDLDYIDVYIDKDGYGETEESLSTTWKNIRIVNIEHFAYASWPVYLK